jgi:hypothetical protein
MYTVMQISTRLFGNKLVYFVDNFRHLNMRTILRIGISKYVDKKINHNDMI